LGNNISNMTKEIITLETKLFPGDIVQCVHADGNRWNSSLLYVICHIKISEKQDRFYGRQHKFWSLKFNEMHVFTMPEVMGCEIILRASYESTESKPSKSQKKARVQTLDKPPSYIRRTPQTNPQKQQKI